MEMPGNGVRRSLLTLRAAAIMVILVFGQGLVSRLAAQISTATVTGTVMDSTGAVVPGANLMLRNVDTHVDRTTSSDSAGRYLILDVRPGRYTLQASAQGFRVAQLEVFKLVVNQTVNFDFKLEVGTMQQVVEVHAVATALQTSTAELGAAVTERAVSDLPLNGRNFTELLLLAPGTGPVNVSQAGQTAPVGTFVLPAVNGQTNRSNMWVTDGVVNQQAVWSTYGVPPIADAIQEFKVQSHNDTAEVGGVLGGTVNVVTKSGTDTLHGSLWEFVKNDNFNARNFFLANVSAFHQNQFGGVGGGPVVIPKVYDGKKHHTFFFLAFQAYRYTPPSNAFGIVPTAKELNGDFSAAQPIYDPFTTVASPTSSSGYVRTVFSGNRIPANQVQPIMVAYAKETLPLPNFSGVGNYNTLDVTPSFTKQNEYLIRLDQNIGQKDQFWFRFSGLRYQSFGSGGFTTELSTTDHPGENFGASWMHTFGPQTVLQVQFGRIMVHNNYTKSLSVNNY